MPPFSLSHHSFTHSVNVRPIHDEVFPRYDFGGAQMSCVRYIHITEVPDQYSIGIFVFPPFARIPLHDHPEMCVLSRLLYGDLQCLSLDLLNAQDEAKAEEQAFSQIQQQHQQHYPSHPHFGTQQQQQQYAQQQQQQHPSYAPQHHPQPPAIQQQQQQLQHRRVLEQLGLPQGSRRAMKNVVKHLHAPDVSMLFPYKGNLHEFFAGPNGAAVLDILLPPYDVEHERDCTFYDIREDPNAVPPPQQPPALTMDAAAMDTDMMEVDRPTAAAAANHQDGAPEVDERSPCWIVPTVQPHDFHCLSGKYQKLGANLITMQDAAT